MTLRPFSRSARAEVRRRFERLEAWNREVADLGPTGDDLRESSERVSSLVMVGLTLGVFSATVGTGAVVAAWKGWACWWVPGSALAAFGASMAYGLHRLGAYEDAHHAHLYRLLEALKKERGRPQGSASSPQRSERPPS